ncbi:MAG TPA: phosphotransferase, partial [Longimicrobiales bacterium]|nr:phosphotransferase [Longimicrobiales bacterium]
MSSPDTRQAPAAAPLAPDAARVLAREHWGIDVRAAAPLPGMHDQNVRIEDADGRARVLKLSGPGEDRSLLELQHAVLARLSERLPDRPFPQAYPSLSGESIVSLPGDDGRPRLARLLDWVPGVPRATVRPKTPELLEETGALVGAVDRALEGFTHPAARRDFDWDLQRGQEVVERLLPAIQDPDRRALVERHMAVVRAAAPAFADLPTGVIHGDANDWNVLVSDVDPERPLAPRRVVSVIDFGDLVESWIVADLAVAVAYAMLGLRAPLEAARAVTRGYARERPLSEREADVLWPLTLLRLCVSVCMAAHQRPRAPDNAYLSVSEAPAWALLERLAAEVHPRFATYALRDACGYPACPAAARVTEWLATGASPGPVLETPAGASGRV